MTITKRTVTGVFVGSLLAIFGGLVLMFAAIWAAYANGALIMNGPDVTGVQATFFGGTMIALTIIGCVAMIGGAIGQFLAWIGAVLNTARLEDKTWFVVLLVLGLFSFGFIAMIAYLVAGPDGTVTAKVQAGIPARPLPVS
jgi:uncharacterized membrane protein